MAARVMRRRHAGRWRNSSRFLARGRIEPQRLLIAYSGTGQKERVIELLQKAYSEHSNAVVQIKVDPMYDPIRSDPRFSDLLRRVRLER